MKAADIMTTKVFTIDSMATVAEAIALMKAKRVRSLIVEPEEDGVYGIVTETDIVYTIAAKDADPEAVLVYQIMTKPCIVVNPDLELKNVARLFAKTGIARAPVIQQRGCSASQRLASRRQTTLCQGAASGNPTVPHVQQQLLGMISTTDLIMKSHVAQPTFSDCFAAKVHENLLHSRVAFDPQEQIERECEAAWDAVEETIHKT